MGISVGVNPPKTPITKGSHGIAQNTIPNICKMPGPPAPFVPTPLPNIAKSELSPQGYSTTVEIEGNAVAIRGATFESIGDIASKGTGGGLISANCQGPAKFISPGSMDVKIEGKNVQQLGDMMLNNCGPGGSPPNTGATMGGETQTTQSPGKNLLPIKCKDAPKNPRKTGKKFTDCEKEEICAKCEDVNRQASQLYEPPPDVYEARAADRKLICDWLKGKARRGQGDAEKIGFCPVSPECHEELKAKAEANNYRGFSPDHIQEIQLGGHPTAWMNLRWMSSAPNSWIGGELKKYKTTDPGKHDGVAPDCCAKE